jgi:hypothetical protein
VAPCRFCAVTRRIITQTTSILMITLPPQLLVVPQRAFAPQQDRLLTRLSPTGLGGQIAVGVTLGAV